MKKDRTLGYLGNNPAEAVMTHEEISSKLSIRYAINF